MALLKLKNKLKSLLSLGLLLSFFAVTPLFASESGDAAFVEGCSAFYRGEWNSAVYLLRKAVSYSEYDNADAYYMLISAEMYSDDNASALRDCDVFLRNYEDSIYSSRVKYLRGKLLYGLGEYEKAVVALSDFCHQNQSDPMYPSALFYIAESLYADYKYDEAESIYETIVTKYPENEKVSAAQYRIESIAQRSREEKLLYLLKQTGEEYLAAKEDYEKQLRYFNAEAITQTREKLLESQAELELSQKRNVELEELIAELEDQIEQLKIDRELKEAELMAEREKLDLERAQREADDIKAQEELERLLAEKDAEAEALLAQKDAEKEALLAEKEAEALKAQQEIEALLAQKEAEAEALLAEKDAEAQRIQKEVEELLAQKNAEAEALVAEKEAEAKRLQEEVEELLARKDAEAEALLAEKEAEALRAQQEVEELLAQKEAETEALLAQKEAEAQRLQQEKDDILAQKEAEALIAMEEAEALRKQKELEEEAARKAAEEAARARELEQKQNAEAVKRLKQKAEIIQGLMGLGK